MENKINDRLKSIIKKENLTHKKFSEIINIKESSLKDMFYRNYNPSSEILQKISEKFPQYSINWLLTGNGEMELNKSSSFNESDLILKLMNEKKIVPYTLYQDLQLKVDRLQNDNGYLKSVLEKNNITYKQTAS